MTLQEELDQALARLARLKKAVRIVVPKISSHAPSDPVAFVLDTADALDQSDEQEKGKD